MVTPEEFEPKEFEPKEREPKELEPKELEPKEPETVPQISIVVPSYQSGQTIAQTLQSLVDQDYPHLEIIVIDGGSTDDTVAIIRQYEPYISWWVSEQDRGQSHALNKGFAQCHGEIVNWLCSDDLLMPGALQTIAQVFLAHPEVDVVAGVTRIEYLSEQTNQPLAASRFWMQQLQKWLPLGTTQKDPTQAHVHLRIPRPEYFDLMPAVEPVHQPSCFYRRKLLDRPQPVDESYNYTMDIELFNYFRSQGARFHVIDTVLSTAPVSGQNKSSLGGWVAIDELERIYRTYSHERIPLTFWHRRLRYPLERWIKLRQSRFWFYLLAPLWVLVTLFLAPFYGLKRVWALRWTGWV